MNGQLIVLRTKDSKWMREVTRDDSVLSPLIPDLPGVSEVVLQGSVAEIILEEWDAYERLLAYIAHIRQERSKNALLDDSDKRDYESHRMTYLLRGTSHVAANRDPPLIYLHEVSRLSRLINFPERWVLFVGVTEESPEVERRDHIRTMGREYMEVGLSFDTKRGYTSMSYPNTVLLGNLARWINTTSEDSVLTAPWWEVYWGLARNLLLRSWDVKDLNAVLDWTMILWGDLVPMMASYKPDGVRHFREDGNVADVVNILAGHGDYTKKIGKAPDVYIADSVLRIKIVHLDELYRRLLLSFPENVDPVALGLEPIIRKKSTGMKVWQVEGKDARGAAVHYLPMINVIPWIHYNSLLLPSLNEKRATNSYRDGTSIAGTVDLREDQFSFVVDRMAAGLGMNGMRRILLSLLHYMDREGSNDRVEMFTSLIEAKLEDSTLPESFQHLPAMK